MALLLVFLAFGFRHEVPLQLLSQEFEVVVPDRVQDRDSVLGLTDDQAVAGHHIAELLHVEVRHRVASVEQFD